MAFNFAWHMSGCLVLSLLSTIPLQGIWSSQNLLGISLYPVPTVMFSALTNHTVTWQLGSLLLGVNKKATSMQYSSHFT